jgi:hypothetical protein
VHCLLRDADRTGYIAAACVTDAMIVHYAVAIRKSRFVDERFEPIGKDSGVHENDRFADAMYPVLDFYSVECGAIESVHHCLLCSSIHRSSWQCEHQEADGGRARSDCRDHPMPRPAQALNLGCID